ncbi:MAG: efflux RND transporter periplasmic adaptor subunit [Cyanobacteriota bacterium]|nr:efflux RND transporter periplasmic adaptor subunit [Cyanobacteriota bacterium]
MTSDILPPDSPQNPSTSSPVPAKKLRHRHPRWLILLVATGALLVAGLSIAALRQTSQGTQTAESRESKILPVETLTVQPVEGYEVSRTYTGEIAAGRASDLGFERGGTLVEVLVEEGDRVSTGQPLARLDTRNLQTQRQQLIAEKARAQVQLSELKAGPRPENINAARAAVQDLEEQLKLQQVKRSRREFLHREGAISREELDEFTYGSQALQARLEGARSNLEELLNGTRWEQIAAREAVVQQLEARIADLDVTLAKSILKAPFAGIVATRQADEGTVVGAGQSVANLVENAVPEARIGLPTNLVNQLQVGNSQTIEIASETYDATVSFILPEIDPDTRTQIVVFALEHAAMPQINPGQTARANIKETIATKGYWLPTASLSQGIRGLWTCYGLTQSDDAEPDVYEIQPQSVEILHQESDRVLARGTLQPGDRIVANGTHRLVPGQKVRPIPRVQSSE